MEVIESTVQVDKEQDRVSEESRSHREIVVCCCPVCHIAGAPRILTVFMAHLCAQPDEGIEEPAYRLRYEPLEGPCLSGPNVSIDGRRVNQIKLKELKELIWEMMYIPVS